MSVPPNRAHRTLLVAPERGEDVFQVLRDALAERSIGNAWIVGRGTFEEVELRDGEVTKTFATTSRIVSLDGRVRAGHGGGELSLAATVSRNGARGPEFLVGEVVRAVAGALELLVTPLHIGGAGVGADLGDGDSGGDRADESADATAEASTEGSTSGRPHARPRIDRPSALSAPSAPAPWAALADASAEAHARPQTAARPAPSHPANAASAANTPSAVRRSPVGPTPLPPPMAPIPPRRKQVDEEIYPEPGDLLDHFAFGRCVVLQSDGDEMVVQNPTSGRTRTIRISALHAEEPTDEGGKRLFRLTQRRTTS